MDRQDEAVKDVTHGLGVGLRGLEQGAMQFLEWPGRTSWHMPGSGTKARDAMSVYQSPALHPMEQEKPRPSRP